MGKIYNQYLNLFVGIPQPPTINSDEKSLYASTYDLVFTVQSYEKPLKVKLKFWKQVCYKLIIFKHDGTKMFIFQNKSVLTNLSEDSNEIYFTPGKLGHSR